MSDGGLLLHGRGRVSVETETRVPTVTTFCVDGVGIDEVLRFSCWATVHR